MLEQMHEAPTDEDRISLLNRFFEKRLLPENDQIDYVTYTLARLNQANGKLKLRTLEEKLGISTRQLERLFKTRIGLSPKEMSRIIRLNGAFSTFRLTLICHLPLCHTNPATTTRPISPASSRT